MLNPLSRFRVRRRSARRTALRIGQLEDRTVPAITVVSASPAPEWVPVPMTYVDLTFNKAVDPLTVQTSDLNLLRGGSSVGTVTGAALVPGTNNQTIRFTMSGLTGTGPV